MKNKKGFTLIELLAVIVILAVLMVIAVPKILDVIENSRRSAAKSSAELYIDAVKKYIAINEVNNKGINIPDDNDLTMGNADDDIELSKIKIKGDSPDYITITFENNNVKEAGFCINDYNIEYKNGNVKISETDYCKFAIVESLEVTNKVESIYTTEEHQLDVTITPSDVTPLYSSTNPEVALVSETGLIKAITPGKTKIIVKAGVKSSIFDLEVIKKVNEGLLGYVEKTNFTNDTVEQVSIEGVTYSLHVYNFDGDQTWSSNPSFGGESDVATASTYAQNMVVVKVNGNLTIDSGVTVTPYASASGYGGPKGFLLYVTGTLTNNGKISMTARGAKAVGQNVYLWKNEDGSYEYVPATGAAGAPSTTSASGAVGSAGTSNRKTGGGGKGGGYTSAFNGYEFGGGSSGTSYSGGSGGGGNYGNTSAPAATKAVANGGAGGSGGGSNYSEGSSGAGNPAGNTTRGKAQNGTGGLLILYANNIVNGSTGDIQANGSNGGAVTAQCYGGGAGSGGGSINIFYNESYASSGSINAKGGSGSAYAHSTYGGGAGGAGTVTTCSIATGSCVID